MRNAVSLVKTPCTQEMYSRAAFSRYSNNARLMPAI